MKLEIIKKYVNWNDFYEYFDLGDLNLNVETIIMGNGFVNWDNFSMDPNLTRDTLELCYPFMKWQYVCMFNKNLTIDFIRDHLNAFNNCWDEISRFQTLNENFMVEFSDQINWTLVSRYQKMSPEFIIKHKYRVDWDNIAKYQSVSPEFVAKNRT